MNWSTHYPTYFASPDEPPSSALASTSTLATTTTPLPTDRVIPAKLALGKQVEFADIGCGFGGLLISLAPLYPDTLMLGQCTSLYHHLSSSPALSSNSHD